MRLHNSGFSIEITVPFDVLEWFINVSNMECATSVNWWCDYCGYNKTPQKELVSEMASDIDRIVCGLATRRLRMLSSQMSKLSKFLGTAPQYQLEWMINGQWESALN